jgi:hypothetical protein
MSLSRPTASTITRKLTCAAAVCLGLLGFSASSAVAEIAPATATCEGQFFSQPFASLKDSNYYTLVEGGEFNSPAEGWELSNGAQIIEGARPDASTGGILDLPSGAVAVSPPVCVTLLYPTARMYVRNVKGAEGVSVGMAYAGTNRTVSLPQNVGQVHGAHNDWTASSPINVQPQIAGPAESTREARFVFKAGGKTSEFQLYDVYVDPRMR